MWWTIHTWHIFYTYQQAECMKRMKTKIMEVYMNWCINIPKKYVFQQIIFKMLANRTISEENQILHSPWASSTEMNSILKLQLDRAGEKETREEEKVSKNWSLCMLCVSFFEVVILFFPRTHFQSFLLMPTRYTIWKNKYLNECQGIVPTVFLHLIPHQNQWTSHGSGLIFL